ncbi:MAG: tRNA glutamyl-Q(34) synthetase GluQRS [Hyphomicrobiales bacterium]|nr:tRNA glutamyl-Q(34) synthetase GluQRS [Hyphomicrobiales bacterium]
MARPVFRFAPSPNGPLHLGHVLAALTAYRAAEAAGGRFLLRIEDIDTTRCRPEYEAAIHDDLAWLGLRWETPVRRQSEHFDDYGRALDRLQEMGLLYRCYASRSEIAAAIVRREMETGSVWPRDPDSAPLVPKDVLDADEIAAREATGAPYALRLDMAAALERISGPLFWLETGSGPQGEAGEVRADPAAWGNVVLARKETPASYHIAVVIDDVLQEITHVVRGQDLFHATSVHRLLQSLLDLPAPVYRHHRLLNDAEGRKLAKSDGDTGLGALRRSGMTPEDVARLVGLVSGRESAATTPR